MEKLGESPGPNSGDGELVQQIVAMGFHGEDARAALHSCDGNLEKALHTILEASQQPDAVGSSPEPPANPPGEGRRSGRRRSSFNLKEGDGENIVPMVASYVEDVMRKQPLGRELSLIHI